MRGSIIEGLALADMKILDDELRSILNSEEHPGCLSWISEKMSVLVVCHLELDEFSKQVEEIENLGFQSPWDLRIVNGCCGVLYGWGTFLFSPTPNKYTLENLISIYQNSDFIIKKGNTHLEAETADIGKMIMFAEKMWGAGYILVSGIKPTEYISEDNWLVKTRFRLSQ